MLSGCWLFSDLDGTLISTPHKAQGKYPSITQSPCFDPIRRWLANGGNICVITTADLRTLDQIYFPLQPYLGQGKFSPHQQGPRKGGSSSQTVAKLNGSHTSGTPPLGCYACRPDKNLSSPSNQDSGKTESSSEGTLLLSLYSGAALYRCTSNSVELLTDYVNSTHRAVYETIDLAKLHKTPLKPLKVVCKPGVSGGGDDVSFENAKYVQGTCISRGVSEKLLVHLTELYESYLSDLLSGVPDVVSASLRLSHRYQAMWKMILRYLDDVYQYVHTKRCVERPASEKSQDLAGFLSTTQRDDKAVLWKMNYLRSRPNLLIFLGVLRVECIVEKAFSSIASASSGQCRLQAVEDQTFLVENLKSLLLKDFCDDVVRAMESRVTAFASYMTHALGVNAACFEKRGNKVDDTLVDVAQVIVLGIPLDLFTRYFVKSIPVFARFGVNIQPQPNSVVFSKLGVTKSTTVRYLLGETSDNDGKNKLEKVDSLSATKVLALGDNPHTTDHGLTVCREVRFISVEKRAQREERHQRIQRRLTRTRLLEGLGVQPRRPDGSVAPSYKELLASLTKCGPLMDDRLFPNIAYVGNEEDGTALFLTALMDQLKVPLFSVSTKLARGPRATPVGSETFAEAVSEALKFANCEMQSMKKQSNL